MTSTLLQLYVSGTSARAVREIASVRQVCEQERVGRYHIEVIDVAAQHQRAETENILATPTLVLALPLPARRWVGDMSHLHASLAGLHPAPAWVPGAQDVGAESLHASDARLREHLAEQREGALVVDTAGVVQLANPAAQRLFARAESALVGVHFGLPMGGAGAQEIALRRPHGAGELAVQIHMAHAQWNGAPAWIATLRDMGDMGEHQRVHDARSLLAAIVDSSDDAIISKDLAGTITSWNPGAERIFGYSAAQAIGQSLLILFPPDRVGEEAEILARIARGERVRDFETARICKDGRRIHVSVSISPVSDRDGNVIGASKIARDITQQRMARDQLARSVSLLSIAGRMALLGGWSIDLPARTLTWSDEVCAIHEVPPGQTPTLEGAIAFYPPEYRDAITLRIEKCLHDGTPFDFELQIVTTSGRRVWVRAMGEAVVNGDGECVRVQGAFQDISARKKAEQALRESEALFRAVIQNSWDAFHLVKPDGRIVFESPSVTRVLGYLPEEMVGRNTLDIVHPDDLHTVREGAPGTAEAKAGMRTIVVRVRHKDGSWRWVESSSVDLLANPDVGAVAVNYRDVTERLALEERLRQSQRLESVGQLTGGVAHDFNNLLTVILGNAESLTDQCGSNAAQRALAEEILEAAQRGADLTQRLLAFARKQALDPKVTDVNGLVGNLDRLLKRTLGEEVEIEIVADPALWPALVDPGQLENALLNLCLNARDAMPGGGRLTMETRNTCIDEDYASKHAEVTAGRYVMLAVSDTGTGIAPEHLARVFEPFFTTKAKGKGTGLGLAMVYGFIKQSGGHASIYSEPGHGTSVKLYLPHAEGAAQGVAPAPASGLPTGGTETILMVEDDAFVRRYAQGQLQRLGYTVLIAEDGHKALALIRSPQVIDLLFTDVVMPGMGGRELADAARQLRPGLRVLYTSGYTENAIVHHGRLDPGVLLLGKPYRRGDLARKIREALTAR